jgi:hypothetical protein
LSIFCRASGTEDWSAIPRSLFASSRYRRVSNGRMRCGPSIIDPRKCHATPTAVGFRQFPAAAVSIFGREDLAANTDPASLRRVVRSRLDRIADLAKKPPDKPGTGRNLERGGCPLHMRRPIQIGAPGEEHRKIEQGIPGEQTQVQTQGETPPPAGAGNWLNPLALSCDLRCNSRQFPSRGFRSQSPPLAVSFLVATLVLL